MPEISIENGSITWITSDDDMSFTINCEDVTNATANIANYTDKVMNVCFKKASGIKIFLIEGSILLQGDIDNNCKITAYNAAECLGIFAEMIEQDSSTEIDAESSYGDTPYSSNSSMPPLEDLSINHSGNSLIGKSPAFDNDDYAQERE